MGEGWKIAQLDFVITGDAVRFTDRGHHFRLLYRVDTQVRFEIEIQIEHVHRIACLLSNQSQYSLLYRIDLRSRGRRRLHLQSRLDDRARRGHPRFVVHGNWRLRRRGAEDFVRFLNNFYHPRCRPLITYPQRAMDDFQFRRGILGDSAQPILPTVLVDNTIGVAQRIRAATDAVVGGHPTQQRHADLRTETRAETYGVLDGIRTALGQIQGA